MIKVNTKYPVDETIRKYEVEIERRLNTMIFMPREERIRFGYEAFDWSCARMSIELRFVTQPTEMMADWK
jgi:hypothetical protein